MPTIDVFIHASRDFTGEVVYTPRSCDMSEHAWAGALVCKVPMSFDLPADFNMTASEIAALEAAKEKLASDFSAAVRQINDRLSKLQAIGWDQSEDNPANYPAEAATASA